MALADIVDIPRPFIALRVQMVGTGVGVKVQVMEPVSDGGTQDIFQTFTAGIVPISVSQAHNGGLSVGLYAVHPQGTGFLGQDLSGS